MDAEDVGPSRCPQTGLSVPECCCGDCLEAMLREFSPELLGGEITVTRVRPEREAPGERREAA